MAVTLGAPVEYGRVRSHSRANSLYLVDVREWHLPLVLPIDEINCVLGRMHTLAIIGLPVAVSDCMHGSLLQ